MINKLSPKTSFGYEGISTKLFKTIKDAILRPITVIINQMLNTGIFPNKLKIAKVIPIFKKDNKTCFTNYQPISLLPAIFTQIYQFFLHNKLLYNAQYGFRTEDSTEYTALELVDRIMAKMDISNTPVNIFLDLSKAFDTLDHKTLLNKLNYYGINGVSLKLMQSYLTDGKQYVKFNDICSEMSTLTTGVPQGSILGPLLFIIYIHDIAQASELFDFIIYADDTILSTTLEIVMKNTQTQTAESTLNTELANVSEWLKELKLLKIKDILQLQELKLYNKYKKNKLPSYLQNMPPQSNSDIHSYETQT